MAIGIAGEPRSAWAQDGDTAGDSAASEVTGTSKSGASAPEAASEVTGTSKSGASAPEVTGTSKSAAPEVTGTSNPTANPAANAAIGTAPASTGAPEAAGSAPAQPAQPGAVVDRQADEADAADAPKEGFAFGSYGRIGVGSDLRGGTPEQANVVAHGSRIGEPAYLELDGYYRLRTRGGARIQTVTTLAFNDTLFHYTGEFDAQPALRNLYAEADIHGRAGLWIGSRMYRGDDIYLLDYWPLDDVNTIGGGGWIRRGKLEVAAHVGANRLLDPFQFQERDVAAPDFGEERIVELDRQRIVASTKATYLLRDASDVGGFAGVGLKGKLYAEIQTLPEGTRRLGDDTLEVLPADFGWTLGAQLGAWGFGHGRSHANLFVRYSRGLTVFDELAPPEGFDPDMKIGGASEVLLGWSANYERDRLAVLSGGYIRRFVDADVNELDRDDGWEYIADIRPAYTVANDVQAAVDLAYQVRFPRGISPTAGIAIDPAVWHIAPMLVYSPLGTGSYDRPVFRLIYRAAHLNEGARDLFAVEDPRRDRTWAHFLGVQAEWWFNSTYR